MLSGKRETAAANSPADRCRTTAVKGESLDPRLPIIIGVVSSAALERNEANRLHEFFVAELTSKRERYPHSPILLVSRTAAPLQETLRSAAASVGVPVIEYEPDMFRAPGGVGPRTSQASLGSLVNDAEFTDCCHVLISVAGGEMGTTGSNAIRLEPYLHLELIDVKLAGAGAAAYAISRKLAAGVEVEPPLGKELGDRALRRTDDFNRDAAGVVRHAGDLPLLVGAPLIDESSRLLQPVFAAADTLSNQYQRKITRAFQVIFALAAVAALFYGVFLIFGSGNVLLQGWLLAAYLLTLLAAYGVYYRAKSRDLYDRFVEYRALAEGARVQLYWMACGLGRVAADRYLVRAPLDLHWIRLALRWATWLEGGAVRAERGPEGTQPALRQWIGRERSYYALSAARSVRAQRRARRLVGLIFALSGLATAVVLLQALLTPLAPFLKSINLMGFVCSVLAAGLVALVQKLGVVYRAEHHSRMLSLYTRAERCLIHCAPGSAADTAAALGEATLRENEEWTVFRRDRRLDEPTSPFRRPW